jgi:hypothetical protein
VVDNIGGRFPAGHVVVIEIIDQDVIDPDVLAAFLSTDAVAAPATGTTIQRVDLRLHTATDVHHGHAAAVRSERATILTAAYLAHPEQFVRKPPQPPELPCIAWINPPTERYRRPHSKSRTEVPQPG